MADEDKDGVSEAPHGAPLEEGLTADAARDVRTVTKGGAVQILGQLSQRGFSFFFGLIYVQLLGKASYGFYRQIAQILAVAGQLGLAGFNYAAMRFIARARARGDAGAVRGATRVAVRSSMVASLIVVVGLLVAAGTIGRRFGDTPADQDAMADLLRLTVLYVPLFALLQIFRYCTQAYKTMVPSVIAGNIVQPFVRFALGVTALLAGFAVAGAMTTLVASLAAGALVAGWSYRRILTDEERRATPRFDTGAMLRFALPQGGASLLGVQSLGLGILVLGALSSDAEAGIFAIALNLQGPATVFLSGIVNIWAPVVSDLYDRGEIARLQSLYQTITRWVATFSFPVLAALILEPDLFVRIYAADRGGGAAAVVAVLAIGNFFYAGTGPVGYVISMTGHPGVNLLNSIAAVVLYVIGGIIFVPRYGALGMAGVDAAVTALVNTARIVEAKVLVGVQPFGRTFLKPVAATLGGAAVLLAWRLVPGDSIPLEIAGIAVASVAYLGLLAAFGMDPEERHVWERIRTRVRRPRRDKV
ncbi:MAG TPA: oligosaccharide flippase family protein [Actinomycetota bacterium]|nr:oligosaccharide flippase family protein [Actinomycetota bacterium]